MANKIYRKLKGWGVKENPAIVITAGMMFTGWILSLCLALAWFYAMYIGIFLISGLL